MIDAVTELINELSAFPSREEDLRKINRWGGWSPMFYRQNDFGHSKRVGFLMARVATVVSKTLGPDFDVRKSIAISLVHDDAEIIIGDYPAGDKAKMSPEQLRAIDSSERAAIVKLSERYPEMLGGFSYRELQQDVQDLRTPEAVVAKYLDVMDGYCEGIHELYAGNIKFTEHVVNEFGLIPLFDNLNFERRRDMMQRHPELAKLKDTHIFFELVRPLSWEETIRGRRPHTLESIRVPVGYAQYDEWKDVIIQSDDSEEIKNLYTQREFS